MQTILKVSNLLDSMDSVAISTAKALMESELIVANLVYISAHYSSIPKNIETLKTKGLPLVESLALVKSLLSIKRCVNQA